MNTTNNTADTTQLTADWVIPDSFKEPEWLKQTEDEFKLKVKELKTKKFSNEKINDVVKKLIYEKVLDKKIKPDYPLNKKNTKKLVAKMHEKFSGNEFIYRYYLLDRLGFYFSTIRPANFSPETLELPDEFKKRKEKLVHEYENKVKTDGKDNAIVWIDKEFDKLTQDVMQYWRDKGITLPDITDAGSRGGPSDIRKMLVAVGLSINSAKEINDVILRSHTEGLEQTQIFNYSSQAIQALYAKSSETAVPGYLARKLSTIAEDIILSETKDCKSTKFLEVEIFDEDVLEALDGRIMHNKKMITKDDKKLIGQKVKIRSPLYCKAQDGICETCYNPKYVNKLGLKPSDKIGLLGSTFMGSDILVNLTLKKSHTGLSINMKEVNLNKDLFIYAE